MFERKEGVSPNPYFEINAKDQLETLQDLFHISDLGLDERFTIEMDECLIRFRDNKDLKYYSAGYAKALAQMTHA
jgi:hypothetical protein